MPGHRYQGQPLRGIKRLIEIAGLRNLENVKLTSYLVQMLSKNEEVEDGDSRSMLERRTANPWIY